MIRAIPGNHPRPMPWAAIAVLLIGFGATVASAQDGAATASSAARDRRDALRFETLRPDNAFRDWTRIHHAAEAPTGTGNFYTQNSWRERADGQGEMVAGYYRSLTDSLSSLVETSYLPNSRGLAEWSFLGQMGAALGDGWGMQAGLRHSELGHWGLEGRRADAQLGLLTLEKIWSSYRSQYTVYSSRQENGVTGSGHRLSLDYLYGQRSSVGLTYGRGWASDNQASLASGVTTNTAAVGVTGEHWLARGWTVNYDALFQQVDDAGGLSPEIRVGLRLAF